MDTNLAYFGGVLVVAFLVFLAVKLRRKKKSGSGSGGGTKKPPTKLR